MRRIKRILSEWVNLYEGIFFVISQITYKELKKKDNENNLGFLWNLINPILYMIVLSTYYGGIITGKGRLFPVYVFMGITMLNYYNIATTAAMHSIVNNKTILVKATMPFEIFIIQKVLVSLRDYLFSFIALMPILYFYDIRVNARAILIIPILVITTFVIFGMGEILAVMYVFFADIDHLYSIFLTVMTLVSGAFIPIEKLPESLHGILKINPIYISIEMSRRCMMYNEKIPLLLWAQLLTWAGILCCFGMILIRNNNNKIMNKC